MTKEEMYAESRQHYDLGREWLEGMNGFDGEVLIRPGTALEEFIKAAELGHDDAQYLLAYMYENGIGSEKDIEKAIEWYAAAASKDHPKAKKAVERLKGGSTEPPEKEELFMSREENMYYTGKKWLEGFTGHDGKIVKDPAKAIKSFAFSAEDGYVPAQYLLAYMYENGQGCKPDIKKAVEWYTAAAEKNHPAAKKALERLGGMRNEK